MAEESINLDNLNIKIPLTNKGKDISVGFNDLGSIKPFDELFGTYFTKNQGQTFTKNLNEISRNINKIIKLSDIAETERKKHMDKLVTAMKNVKDAIEENKKQNEDGSAFEKIKPTLIKISNEIGKAISQSISTNMKRITILRDIESAGVTIVQGFDSLRQASVDLARPQEQLAKLYTKNSQTLQKLTATYGDGVNVFNQSLQKISGKYNLSRQEEENVLSSYMETRVKYSNFEQINQDIMNQEMEKYTKNLKEMSKATGKSIDLIIEENKLKEGDLVYNSFIASSPTAKMLKEALTAQGFSDSLVKAMLTNDVSNEEYIGFMSTTEGKAIVDAVQKNKYNSDLTYDDWRKISNDIYDKNAKTREEREQLFKNNPEYSWAVYGQMGQFGSGELQAMNLKKLNEKTNKDDADAIDSARKFDDEVAKVNLMYENLMTQSTKTFTKELDIATAGLKAFNEKILEPIHKMKLDLKDNAFWDSVSTMGVAVGSGAVTGLVQSAGSTSISGGKSWLGKIGNWFKGGSQSNSASAAKTPKSKFMGKLGTVGKAAGSIGSLMQTGEVLSDFSNKGVTTAVQDIKDNWGGWDWLNPSKMSAVAGDWIGEQVGDFMSWVSGGMSDEERKKMIEENYKKIQAQKAQLKSPKTPQQPNFGEQKDNQQNENKNNNNNIVQPQNIEKEIKELNQIMVDVLQKMDTKLDKVNMQLENIGYFAKENNTGAV